MANEKFHLSRRYLLFLLLFVVGLYIILPQFGNFKQSWVLLKKPDIYWLSVSIVFASLTYFAAATTYCLLAFKKLSYWKTLLFQTAAMFINRLLPGGIGALGANFAYLRKAGHSSAQAGTMVGVNNLFGFIGHLLLTLVIAAIYTGSGHSLVQKTHLSWVELVRYGVVLLIVAIVLIVIFGKNKLRGAYKDVKLQVLSYKNRPGHLLAAIVSSMSLTVCNVLCLYACMWALGVHLPFWSVFLIFSLGVGAGTATPTPGGLGGYEAALLAGFVAYHVDGATALAIVLLYRLVSYWLPLVVGGVAFIISERRGYI